MCVRVCMCVRACLNSVGYQQMFAPPFVQATKKGAAMLQGNMCVSACVRVCVYACACVMATWLVVRKWGTVDCAHRSLCKQH